MTKPKERRTAEKRIYIVYDARVEYDGAAASVLTACDTLAEAKAGAASFGSDFVIYSDRLVDSISVDARREP